MKPIPKLPMMSIACALTTLGACDPTEPTYAVVHNDYPESEGTDVLPRMVVYKVWWSLALFAEPLAPQQASERARVVPEHDYAYALLAPNWDESSAEPPERLIAVRSRDKWRALLGHTLHVSIAEDLVLGECARGQVLTQADADFITQRVFPGEFAGRTYDAATCTLVPLETDAGIDAGR